MIDVARTIPAPFRGSSCASDLGDYRPCEYTYERYAIDSIPPIDEASGTGCWTNISPPLDSPLEPDARMVRFFRDQQDCVMWYLYLRPSGESFVVHSYRDIELEAEIRAGGDPEEIEDLPDYDLDPDYEIFWCAPTVEAFTYRVLIEGAIQRAFAEGRGYDDLDPRQQSYLAHYVTSLP